MKKLAVKSLSILTIGGTIAFLILPGLIEDGWILVILAFCIVCSFMGFLAYNELRIQKGNQNVLDAINGAFNIDLEKQVDAAKQRMNKAKKHDTIPNE